MPNADELQDLHCAFLSGNPDAFERLITACRPRLVALLRGSFLYLTRDMVDDAAIDALLFLFQYPERFDPARGSLLNFLKTVAERRLIDEIRRQKRENLEFVGGNVEFELVEANHYREENAEPLSWRNPDVMSQEFAALLAEILPDPVDRQIAAVIGQGRADTAQIAALLGLSHLPPEQQKAEAKRNRDRIVKKLQRRREDFRRFDE